MNWLVLGIGLWVGAHLFKRMAPRQRQRMGKAGRGVVAVLILGGVISMVMGYRGAEYVHLFALPDWARHVNNALMLAAIFLLDVGRTAGIVRCKIRHPMLLAVVVWAVAHILVNGDLASLVLFGGLGLWALAEMAVINRAEGLRKNEGAQARLPPRGYFCCSISSSTPARRSLPKKISSPT